ncbi:MAG: alkaline phosphatase family protein [Polyangiales bacterium]
MRKTFPCALVVAFLLGCSGSTPETNTTQQDTGSSIDDDTATDDDSGSDDTAVEPAFDTGTAGDSSTGETSPATDSTLDDTGSASDSSSSSDGTPEVIVAGTVKTVFIILMENHSWSSIKASKSAPYINSLLGTAAHAEGYMTPPKNHPSEPNYIWLEAGNNLGITTDNDPSSNHQATKDHLVTQLETAGVTWKAYQEDIDGKSCPLTSTGLFAAKHCPMLFFDDITDTNKSTSKHCMDHIRPFPELDTDLAGGTGLARYNFITPNLCHDMHGDAPFGTKCNDKIPLSGVDLIKMGDDWLKTVVPNILASAAYKDNGALFITWDEGDEGTLGLGTASDGPIGMIVLSPLAKSGYSNSTKYDHSSTVKTMERIFGVPYLRGAAAAGTTDLGDLFSTGALP